MTRSSYRFAVAVSASLFALPALADPPAMPAQSDWPAIEQPRPARTLPAQPAGTTSAVSGDPTWPAVSVTMPAIAYSARADTAPVFEPPVDAHQAAMAAARVAATQAAPARLAAK